MKRAPWPGLRPSSRLALRVSFFGVSLSLLYITIWAPRSSKAFFITTMTPSQPACKRFWLS